MGDEAMVPIRDILVPIDWSESSGHAFHLAAALARDHDAQLLLLYVLPLPAVMYGPPPEGFLEHMLDELRRIKPADPKVDVRYLVAEGNPAAAILRAARESHSDLIVMGTHGRTGLTRLVMGSVAEEVVRKAPCPVLTVRADGHPGPGGDGLVNPAPAEESVGCR
jgi:nucleotide-binding universal stress UspA family protein